MNMGWYNSLKLYNRKLPVKIGFTPCLWRPTWHVLDWVTAEAADAAAQAREEWIRTASEVRKSVQEERSRVSGDSSSLKHTKLEKKTCEPIDYLIVLFISD